MAAINKEIWKDIPGYIGYYQASNFGRIKSLSRKHKRKNNSFYISKEKILNIGLNNHGYLQVHLCKNNKPKMCRVHQLILLTFQGKCPKGMECCHNDGVRTNNYYSNLRYDTRKNNHADKKLHGTDNKGEKNHFCVLNKKQVLKIKKLLKSGKYYQREIAKKFNVSQSRISYIKTGKNWSWLKKKGIKNEY